MAAVSCVLSEDQFLCSICLEVFTDPVTTPCGHSFCKNCINKHWDHSPHCSCPVCKESFSSRPQLKLNTFMSEMVHQLKNKPQDEDLFSTEPQATKAEVLCDVCSETKLKAVKSCLACLLSYCQNHLQPHITVPRLKNHQLIHPLENLEDRICSQHGKPLELFCRDDSTIICVQCICADHKGHNAVSLKEECEVKQEEMKEVIEMIKKRREKVEEIQRSVERSQNNADREMTERVKVFNDLMKCIEESLKQFKQSIEEKHKKMEEEAEGLIEKIEREISSLEQRRTEMDQLWSSEDHLHVLQTFTSVRPALSVKDWTQVTVKEPSCEGTLDQTVSELKNTLLPKIKVFVTELRQMQQYAVDVTLDPDTAHPNLVLSKDLKQVHHIDQKQNLPEKHQRFSSKLFVLGKQKFISGRFYFEVQVKGKPYGIIGVVKESIDRKIKNLANTEDGYWCIYRVGDQQYKASTNPPINVNLQSSPEKVGVFVDYEKGLVSFYNVDTAEVMYSFTNCCFTESILPLFSPCMNKSNWNSAPLILTPVAK